MQPARINVESMFPGALFAGFIGIIICWGLLFTGAKPAISGSYLFAWVFWLSLTVGAFGFSLLYHLIRGRWMTPLLRMFEAAGGPVMMLAMAVLFLPIVFQVATHDFTLYQWLDPSIQKDAMMIHKAPYLNSTGWIVRFVIWFASWAAIGAGFRASTLRQEKTGDLKELVRRNNWAGASFIYFFLSATFAMVDWVISLDYRWYSTMFGAWSIVQMGLGAFAFCVVIFCVNSDREPFNQVVTPALTRDLGNILFVLTMLWAYTSFSQFLIIWSGNLPETNFYYVERSRMSWDVVGMITLIGQFFVPFVTLLTPRNRKIPKNLAFIAAWMFVIHLVDVYQYVLPALRHNGPMPTGYDLLAFASVGLVWLGAFGGILRKSQLLPKFDSRIQEDAFVH